MNHRGKRFNAKINCRLKDYRRLRHDNHFDSGNATVGANSTPCNIVASSIIRQNLGGVIRDSTRRDRDRIIVTDGDHGCRIRSEIGLRICECRC